MSDSATAYTKVDDKTPEATPEVSLAVNDVSSMYAVVDKTKKSRAAPKKCLSDGDFASMYAVVDKTKKSRPDSNLARMYAVVDKTNKSRFTPNESQPDNNDVSMHDLCVENASTEIAPQECIYDNVCMFNVLDKTENFVVSSKKSKKSHPDDNGVSMCDKVIENASTEISDVHYRKNDQMPKKTGIIFYSIVALLAAIALFIAAVVVIITAFVQISKLSHEVKLIQLTLSSTLINTSNTTKLVMSVQALEKSINTERDMIAELNHRLSGALELSSSTAANFSNLENELNYRLENIPDSISIQLSFVSQIIAKATGNSKISQSSVLVDALNGTGHAFNSCAAIWQLSPSSPSGNYYIRSSNGSAVSAYCDMTRTCGGITGGWMRVAELDMTNNTTLCPSSLELATIPRRTCRTMDSSSGLCSSDTFPVVGKYSNVCGRIRAYQVGSLNAFGNSNPAAGSSRETSNPNIETYYVDGVSLTHGMSPRQHIWTFVGAANENILNLKYKCYCIDSSIQNTSFVSPPAFVGNDYFCDTAALVGFSNVFHADDPLWDGAGCGPRNTCCSFNSPPWFYKLLPQPTTDGIEMRVCRDEEKGDEDIAIEVVEIYVQ